MTPLLDADTKERAHLLAGPHTNFCQCLAGIHQQPIEVRRAALTELLTAVHAALEQLDEEEEET